MYSTSRYRLSVTEQVAKENPQPTYDEVKDRTFEKSVQEKEEINPLFNKFCEVSDKIYHEQKDEKAKSDYERVINDYLVLKMAAHTELTIMELNRVGVEKNMKNIIE